jgi:hypothetical protein
MMASTMSVAILAAMNEVTTFYILRNFCALICGKGFIVACVQCVHVCDSKLRIYVEEFVVPFLYLLLEQGKVK